MSAQQPDAPEVIIKNLIRDAWTAANLDPALTPHIHHGWLESEQDGYYEVTVSNPDESPINGGDTGYSGVDPTGAGPTQRIGGTVNVNVWAQRGRTGEDGVTEGNPRKVAYMMKAEVERILHEVGFDGVVPDGAGGQVETDLNFIAPQGATRLVEPDEEPTMYRYEVLAGYGYSRRP